MRLIIFLFFLCCQISYSDSRPHDISKFTSWEDNFEAINTVLKSNGKIVWLYKINTPYVDNGKYSDFFDIYDQSLEPNDYYKKYELSQEAIMKLKKDSLQVSAKKRFIDVIFNRSTSFEQPVSNQAIVGSLINECEQKALKQKFTSSKNLYIYDTIYLVLYDSDKKIPLFVFSGITPSSSYFVEEGDNEIKSTLGISVVKLYYNEESKVIAYDSLKLSIDDKMNDLIRKIWNEKKVRLLWRRLEDEEDRSISYFKWGYLPIDARKHVSGATLYTPNEFRIRLLEDRVRELTQKRYSCMNEYIPSLKEKQKTADKKEFEELEKKLEELSKTINKEYPALINDAKRELEKLKKEKDKKFSW